MDDVERALEELAVRFEMAGDVMWSSAQVADAIRKFSVDPDDPLTNHDDGEK